LPQGEDNLRLSPQFSKPPFMLGLYRAELNLAWGDKPETLTRSVYIWVLPWLHISGGLAALALLYFGLKFGIRRYNRRIIAKHLAAQKKEE
jgi:acyl-CoA synthetase (AMP-forming)/AMP-acid ligase II